MKPYHTVFYDKGLCEICEYEILAKDMSHALQKAAGLGPDQEVNMISVWAPQDKEKQDEHTS